MLFIPFWYYTYTCTHAHTRTCKLAFILRLFLLRFLFYLFSRHRSPHAQQWQNFHSPVRRRHRFYSERNLTVSTGKGVGFDDDGYNHRSPLATVCRLLLSRLVGVYCSRYKIQCHYVMAITIIIIYTR